jgi:hypothetical protein
MMKTAFLRRSLRIHSRAHTIAARKLSLDGAQLRVHKVTDAHTHTHNNSIQSTKRSRAQVPSTVALHLDDAIDRSVRTGSKKCSTENIVLLTAYNLKCTLIFYCIVMQM